MPLTNPKIQWFERALSKPKRKGLTLVQRVMLHLRRKLIAGLLIVMPLAITAYLSVWFFGFVTKAQWVQKVADQIHVHNDHVATAITLVGTIFVLYLIGLVSTTMLVKTFIRVAEALVTNIPLVKSIYGLVKQVVDAFKKPEGTQQIERKVALVEYPRAGCFGLGFVTAESIINGVLHCHVLVLTTPNPTSGWVLFIPASDVWECGMTPDEGMKFILSGGIVSQDAMQLTPYKPTNAHLQTLLAQPAVEQPLIETDDERNDDRDHGRNTNIG